jgi:Kef-type K+ transport system membrane component KefB
VISFNKQHTGRPSSWPAYLGAYVALVSATIGAFIGVSRYGERTLPAASLTREGGAWIATAGASDLLLHVLLGLAAIVLTCRVAGWLLARIGQPAVIGEMIGGIVLGPTVLGYVAPDAMRFLFARESMPFISIIAQLGVMLYMFLVGLELDTAMLRRRVHAAVATSHASIAVPFTLGAVAALYLFPSMSTPGVPFTTFALFVGIALSITAFPVLARILASRRMSHQELGTVALACAAGDDVTAWCLLAVLVGVGSATPGATLVVLLSTVAFIAVMALVIQPIVRRWVASETRTAANTLGGVLIGVLLSALATETIGIHAIFGAFMFGYIIPHDSRVAVALKRDLSGVVTTLLLPPFFAFTGMRTAINLGSGVEYWLICLALILVATIGKVGGAMVSARLTGMTWRYAAGLGVLMNTRGLMELIVLNIGLDQGIITPTFFSMMVLMAIVTTLMTVPGLRILRLGTAAPAAPAAAATWPDAEALAQQ